MKSKSKRERFQAARVDLGQADESGGIYDDLLKKPAHETLDDAHRRCFARIWLALQKGDAPALEDIEALQTWLNAVRAEVEAEKGSVSKVDES